LAYKYIAEKCKSCGICIKELPPPGTYHGECKRQKISQQWAWPAPTAVSALRICPFGAIERSGDKRVNVDINLYHAYGYMPSRERVSC
jgi:ferredoxin